MARDRNDRRKGAANDRRRVQKKKVSILTQDKIDWVDYKDVNLLRRFMSDRGKIRARRVTGNCSQHQSKVAIAIKTARELALLPYTQRTVSERGPGRGGGGGGRGGPGRGGPPSGEDREAPMAAPPDEDALELDTDAGDDVEELAAVPATEEDE